MDLIEGLYRKVGAELERGAVGRLVWVKLQATVPSDLPHSPLLRTLLQLVLAWFGRRPESLAKVGDPASSTILLARFDRGEGAIVALTSGPGEKAVRFFVDVLGDRGAVYLDLPGGADGWRVEPWPGERTAAAARLLEESDGQHVP